MKAVILAGGLGTRLGSLTRSTPKPMVRVADTPVLEHQIQLLKEFGVTDIILVVCYLSDVIRSYFGDGSRFGVKITYHTSTDESGTAGSLLGLKSKLRSDFLVLYGDTMMSFDIARFQQFHARHRDSVATLFVHPNDHPFDSDLIDTDSEDRIIAMHPKPHPTGATYRNLVNAGIYLLLTKIFPFINAGDDFGKDVFPRLLTQGKPLYAYSSPEYCKDMGTPQRLAAVERDVRKRLHHTRRLDRPQRAVFLDRDGVLIEQIDQLHKLSDVSLFPYAAKAIRTINESGWLAIVITNQPMIARGLLSFDGLQEIHNHIETQLGNEHAKLDAIYFCPHHPHHGYDGEIAELKIECDCRKPNPGLVLQAAERFNIDLASSLFIGDSTSDILTAHNSGVRSVLVRSGFGGNDKKYSVQPDHVFDDVLQAVESLLL